MLKLKLVNRIQKVVLRYFQNKEYQVGSHDWQDESNFSSFFF